MYLILQLSIKLAVILAFMTGIQLLVVPVGQNVGPQTQLRDIRRTIDGLFKKLESLQEKHDIPYIPPMFWKKRKGMYQSDVKFYFHGHLDMYLFREMFSIYDDNMFATTWITSCLLETFRYGQGPKPSEEQILAAITSISGYHNKNVNFNNSLMTFWPQLYNTTTQTWISYPQNLHHFFQLTDGVNATELEKLLDDIGLADIADIMKSLLKSKDGYLQAFKIPPDFDDTFVNLGLGSLLTEMATDFPLSHDQWKSQNRNISSIFDALKKYVYRPLSNNRAVNTIDGRTYFYLRYFLYDLKNRGEDIALISTWIQDLDEMKTLGPKGVLMPLDVNNVDVTVAANGVFGITTAILNGLVDVTILDDPDIRHIYLNTSSLIAFMIETNFSSRPDLALLYYPSAFEFYWFVARTYGELHRKAQYGPLPHPLLKTVMDKLGAVLHSTMTSAVLNATKSSGEGFVYFDDFLGDGDRNANNVTEIRGEDRIFTTAMAVNALLSTWTVFRETDKHLVWQEDTPTEVKTIAERAAKFLQKEALAGNYKPWNAFFSGSVKGMTTYPLYPINRYNLTLPIYIMGMEGIIPESQYQQMLNFTNPYFHIKAPIDFHGYNSVPDFWPFWSSPSYTYVISMLALAKYSNTVEPSDSRIRLEDVSEINTS